jgi:hypothetical protein
MSLADVTGYEPDLNNFHVKFARFGEYYTVHCFHSGDTSDGKSFYLRTRSHERAIEQRDNHIKAAHGGFFDGPRSGAVAKGTNGRDGQKAKGTAASA